MLERLADAEAGSFEFVVVSEESFKSPSRSTRDKFSKRTPYCLRACNFCYLKRRKCKPGNGRKCSRCLTCNRTCSYDRRLLQHSPVEESHIEQRSSEDRNSDDLSPLETETRFMIHEPQPPTEIYRPVEPHHFLEAPVNRRQQNRVPLLPLLGGGLKLPSPIPCISSTLRRPATSIGPAFVLPPLVLGSHPPTRRAPVLPPLRSLIVPLEYREPF
ncbi:hypothetical protein GYMLUDRAFT_38662 [Collybiopsis luxurians FD-317 M1]|nr:hypothetical protein GYMLUDRAFT_38662 [Collybiopsis luxurians FD-317 M1]